MYGRFEDVKDIMESWNTHILLYFVFLDTKCENQEIKTRNYFGVVWDFERINRTTHCWLKIFKVISRSFALTTTIYSIKYLIHD